MPKIVIRKSDTLPVILEIDLVDYLQAYLDFNANRVSVDLEEAFNNKKCLLNNQLTGLRGEMLWIEIKKELASRLKNTPEDIAFASILLVKSESNLPVAIRSLNISFIELLKNSIDAWLENSLILRHPHKLEVRIDLTLNNEQLSVQIIDNAGGFAQDYINNFDEYVGQKGYKYERKSSRKAHFNKELYLGGAGKGMAMFLNYVIDGELMLGQGKSQKLLNTSEKNSVHISNVDDENDKGMKMTINSPLKPCEEYQNSPNVKKKSSKNKTVNTQDVKSGIFSFNPSINFFKSWKNDSPRNSPWNSPHNSPRNRKNILGEYTYK